MPLDEKFIRYIGGSDIEARFDYQCGHCNRHISGRVVSIYGSEMRFMICPSCLKGSVWLPDKKLIPRSKPGQNLEGLPVEVEAAYQEVRKCYSISAFTACELLCRKILMHVGVDKGAQEGKALNSFSTIALGPFEEIVKPEFLKKKIVDEIGLIEKTIINLIKREAGQKTVSQIKAIDN